VENKLQCHGHYNLFFLQSPKLAYITTLWVA